MGLKKEEKREKDQELWGWGAKVHDVQKGEVSISKELSVRYIEIEE